MKTIKIIRRFTAFASLALLFNCATEDVIQPQPTIQQDEIKSRFISEEELKTFVPGAFEKINDFNNAATANASAKLSQSNKYKFSVDTDQVLMIQKGDYKSFTFPVKRSTPNGLLENLFLHPYNGGYLPFLFKYNFTAADLNYLAQGIKIPNLISKIKFVQLENFDMGDLGVNIDRSAARGGTTQHTMMFDGVCYTVGSITNTDEGAVINWVACNDACTCDTSTPGSGGGSSQGISMGTYCALVDIRSSLNITIGGGPSSGGGSPQWGPFNPPSINPNPLNPQTPGLYNGNPIFGVLHPQFTSLNYFVNSLTNDQRAFWNNTQQNAYLVTAMKLYFTSQGYSQANSDFIKSIIDTLLADENSPVYTLSDYPGKSNNMPFEWWKDQYYIYDNLLLPSEDTTAPDETPNAAEVLLFEAFPREALLHIQNSTTALDKANQLVATNVLTEIHNGKADAFRHAFWNALDTAEFRSVITKLFTDAHEWNSGNHPLETQMDIFNNAKGRTIGGSFSFTSTDAAIATAVMNSLTSGGLKYLNPLNNGAITTATVLKFTNQ